MGQKTRLQATSVLCLWILGLLLLASGIALRQPVMDTTVRAIVAATLIFAVYTGFVHIARLLETAPKTLYPIIFFVGLALLWCALSSKPPHMDGLTTRYLNELNSFTGDKYVWGGESHAGVDCSGLARSSMWQAMLKQGTRELNSYLLGPRLWKFWWRDMSAKDMLDQRYGYTIKLGITDKLAGYDHTNLRPGDLAIAGKGAHVLVYLGENRWIEANPDDGKVVANEAKASSRRPYFNMKVTLMRWWIMQNNQ